MTIQPQTPDLGVIKERQQKTWSAGNFAQIGNLMVLMGERLCEAVDLRSGSKVLDVATGSGNAAISAARRFCVVTGIDYVPELIEYARNRADTEQMRASFESSSPSDIRPTTPGHRCTQAVHISIEQDPPRLTRGALDLLSCPRLCPGPDGPGPLQGGDHPRGVGPGLCRILQTYFAENVY